MENSYNKFELKEMTQRLEKKIEDVDTPVLVIVSGHSGCGKDFLIDKTIKTISNNSNIKTKKTESKKSDRPRRKDEFSENSRSGTKIFSDKKALKKTKNAAEYSGYENNYAIDETTLTKEIKHNKIVFIPMGNLSKLNGSQNAINNFFEINKQLSNSFSSAKIIHLNIVLDIATNTQNLRNRIESNTKEIKNRIRSVQINNKDRVFLQALKNKKYVTEVINNFYDSEESVANILVRIEEKI